MGPTALGTLALTTKIRKHKMLWARATLEDSAVSNTLIITPVILHRPMILGVSLVLRHVLTSTEGISDSLVNVTTQAALKLRLGLGCLGLSRVVQTMLRLMVMRRDTTTRVSMAMGGDGTNSPMTAGKDAILLGSHAIGASCSIATRRVVWLSKANLAIARIPRGDMDSTVDVWVDRG